MNRSSLSPSHDRPVATHNAAETTPRASQSDAGGLGEVCASSHTPTERVHGEGIRKYILLNALRLRFRLVASDFPSSICILDGDRLGAVESGKKCEPGQAPLTMAVLMNSSTLLMSSGQPSEFNPPDHVISQSRGGHHA